MLYILSSLKDFDCISEFLSFEIVFHKLIDPAFMRNNNLRSIAQALFKTRELFQASFLLNM